MSKKKRSRKYWGAWRGWLVVGIGIKRWLLILVVGAALIGVGIGLFFYAIGSQGQIPDETMAHLTLKSVPLGIRIGLPVLVGWIFIVLAIFRLSKNLVAPFRRQGEGLAESLHNYTQKSRGPRIVAIGGGTGMPALLLGLREFTSNITAIVTVADDGGSSGRLRSEMGVLPPGDFRNNIASLARDQVLMAQLLQYRFSGRPEGNNTSDGDLRGHAFGNLLLVALTGITGSFDEALLAAERVLALRGRVLPSTLSNVALVADVSMEAGSQKRRVIGESAIPKSGGQIQTVSLEPADIPAYPPAVRAILQADIVVIGPGSLYTSILPNLLIPAIAQAIQHTQAKRVYVCNLATQPGETDNYTVGDHVDAISRHVAPFGMPADGWVDKIIANNNLSIPPTTGGGTTVYVKPIGTSSGQLVTLDLVDEKRPWRHDSHKLARAVLEMV
jgi:uncharacterized cofD-like protein